MSLPFARLAKPGETPSSWDRQTVLCPKILAMLRKAGEKYSHNLKSLDYEALLTPNELMGRAPMPSYAAIYCRRSRRIKGMKNAATASSGKTLLEVENA